jgi:hypothetical protein
LRLKEVTTQFYFGESNVYPKPPGRGAGNVIYFTGAITPWGSAPGTASTATNHGFCWTVADHLTEVTGAEGPGIGAPVPTVGRAPKSIAQCQQTISFADGDLQLEGKFDQVGFEGPCVESAVTATVCRGSVERLAVTGGTGRYAGARGEATLQQYEYPDVIEIVVTLLPA